MAHLTLVVQGREVRKFVLNSSVTTIGRAQDNDIVINNLALSRRHAEVHFRRGWHEVEDLGSQNGVYVNGQRIRGPMRLENGGTVTLGTYQFVYNADAAQDPDIHSAPRPRRALEVTQLEAPEDPREEPPEAEPVPLLVLKYNDVELQRFPLRGDAALVGRAKECTIQIPERRLSRRHCEIFRADDRHYLRDLGSQNGTYVNRKKIPDRYELRSGDVLNFAEYTILFLADAATYDGPDRDVRRPAPRPDSDIEREETAFPEAYAEAEPPRPSILPDAPVRPSSLDDDPDDSTPRAPVARRPERRKAEDPADPFVERPALAKERRQARRPEEPERREPPRLREAPRERIAPATTRPVEERRRDEPRDRREERRPVEERRRDEPRERREEPREAREERRRDEPREIRRKPLEVKNSRSEFEAKPSRPREPDPPDIEDNFDERRPDPELDDWYASRDENSPYEEEPSVLLERSKSSMSQLLSTMMVGKGELDRNLAVRTKQRKYIVDVTWGNETIYSGPLKEDVTILGTDKEADIKLRGRYVAGRHSLLVRVRDSLLLVRLGSSSAARVNGLPKLQAFLKSGDVIQIDETTIKLLEE